MIISASRRTDIPSFFPKWFIKRTREGFCLVSNPFNKKTVRRVSLNPDDVSAIVFWTKNAGPIIPFLDELNNRGYKYYFQYTVTGYPKLIEPGTPRIEDTLVSIENLARKIGRERIVWRYDPVVFTTVTPFSWHTANFRTLADRLRELSSRVIVSVFDEYRAAKARMKNLEKIGVYPIPSSLGDKEFHDTFLSFAEIARANQMEIFSCADKTGLRNIGIPPGSCIDNALVQKLFGIRASGVKDKSQRKECLCATSVDIGAYDTCPGGCEYCYATGNMKTAGKNFSTHDIESPSLLGGVECKHEENARERQTEIAFDSAFLRSEP